MPDFIIGGIVLFGGNFAPRNYAICEGQTLTIPDNSALFAILSNMYGGDGRNTFQLPDLRGRAPVGFGQTPGQPTDWRQGLKFGKESATLTTDEMPAHSHATSIQISTTGTSGAVTKCYADDPGSTGVTPSAHPGGRYWGPVGGGNTIEAYYEVATPGATMASDAVEVSISGISGTMTIENTGGGLPFGILQPLQASNYIICIRGIFPSRN